MQEADQEGLLKELKAVQYSLSTLQKLMPGSTAADEPAMQGPGAMSQQAEQGGSSAMQALADDVADLVEVSCFYCQLVAAF